MGKKNLKKQPAPIDNVFIQQEFKVKDYDYEYLQGSKSDVFETDLDYVLNGSLSQVRIVSEEVEIELTNDDLQSSTKDTNPRGKKKKDNKVSIKAITKDLSDIVFSDSDDEADKLKEFVKRATLKPKKTSQDSFSKNTKDIDDNQITEKIAKTPSILSLKTSRKKEFENNSKSKRKLPEVSKFENTQVGNDKSKSSPEPESDSKDGKLLELSRNQKRRQRKDKKLALLEKAKNELPSNTKDPIGESETKPDLESSIVGTSKDTITISEEEINKYYDELSDSNVKPKKSKRKENKKEKSEKLAFTEADDIEKLGEDSNDSTGARNNHENQDTKNLIDVGKKAFENTAEDSKTDELVTKSDNESNDTSTVTENTVNFPTPPNGIENKNVIPEKIKAKKSINHSEGPKHKSEGNLTNSDSESSVSSLRSKFENSDSSFNSTLRKTSASLKGQEKLPEIQPIKNIIGLSHLQIFKLNITDVKIKTLVKKSLLSKYANTGLSFALKHTDDLFEDSTKRVIFYELCIYIALYEALGFKKIIKKFDNIIELFGSYKEINLDTTRTKYTPSTKDVHQNNFDYSVLAYLGHILIWAADLQLRSKVETIYSTYNLDVELKDVRGYIGGGHLWDRLVRDLKTVTSKRWKHIIKFRTAFPFEIDQFTLILRFMKVDLDNLVNWS